MSQFRPINVEEANSVISGAINAKLTPNIHHTMVFYPLKYEVNRPKGLGVSLPLLLGSFFLRQMAEISKRCSMPLVILAYCFEN